MLHIAVCDDRAEQVKAIHTAAEAYFSQQPEHTVQILDFNNAVELLAHLEQSGGCDIALLDICMPGISGLEVAQEMRRRKQDTEIIFLTTSAEFAVDAFALQAAHYLLKPFSQAQFNAAMQRVMERFAAKAPAKLLLLTENGVLQAIDAKSVYYVESVGQERVVHTHAGLFREQRRSLSRLLQELEALLPGRFIMPYRGYIVNQDRIRTIAPTGVTLQNGAIIPIKSRDFRRLREAFFQWSFAGRDDKC